MIVYDVENYAHTMRVRVINEKTEIIRRTIQSRRREEIDTVVTPPECAGELCDRHYFDDADSEVGEVGEVPGSRAPCAFARVCAHVHFIDNRAHRRWPAPRRVRPPERAGIDYLRWTVRPGWLEAGRRIGEWSVVIEAKAIQDGIIMRHVTREETGCVALEEKVGSTVLKDYRYSSPVRSPDPKVDRSIRQSFRTERTTPLVADRSRLSARVT
jgi:hypothetical protein